MGIDVVLPSVFEASEALFKGKASIADLITGAASPEEAGLKIIQAHFDALRATGGYYREAYDIDPETMMPNWDGRVLGPLGLI
jgi:hypothetical protein